MSRPKVSKAEGDPTNSFFSGMHVSNEYGHMHRRATHGARNGERTAMQRGYHLIAIGGGGFTHDEDPALDAYCLEGLPQRPRLGFIGAASGDAPDRIARFYSRFADCAAALSHLPLDATAQEARDWLAGLDLVYLGGGNTAFLVDHLRRTGLGAALAEAMARGTILAGVSAGAACWFDGVLSDSRGDGLRPLPGLGVLPGSICPHFSTEPHRRPAFRDAIARGELPAGLAIDDGVAVRLRSGHPPEVFAARPQAGAYHLRPDASSGFVQTRL